MNPQEDKTLGLGLPQPGNDMSQLPSIHAPQTFRPPENATPQFGIGTASISPASAVAPTIPQLAPPPPAQPAIKTPAYDPVAAVTSQFAPPDTSTAPAEDVDTPFDEEWVAKAKEVVGRTHADPFMQSKELSKLKAQYIKARYNKDIKIGE